MARLLFRLAPRLTTFCVFHEGDVHYRIKVNYYDYKLFASKVTITEVDDISSISVTPDSDRKSATNLESCVTNRNAPPVSPYHWPADAAVKVYLFRNMFNDDQRAALLEALNTWTQPAMKLMQASLSPMPVKRTGW